ncbi:hypothetical protein CEQ90_07560 [Lewinellaceae bacterium SD302]|nr:hypothetical protein CEQ90_07560 [Lewinellaceae bacterium SD302]
MPPLLRNIIRSFPLQLLLLHLRKNLMLLLWWMIFTLTVLGFIAPDLGAQYLFLDPEYLGRTGFWSFLLMGLAFGFYVMSWNLSTYLLLANKFEFLACLARPFLKWCINNALLPLAIFFTYLVSLYRFYGVNGNWSQLLAAWGGLLVGLVLSLILYMLYFYLTNRDVYYYTGHRPIAPNRVVLEPFGRQRGLMLAERRQRENPYNVKTYLGGKLRPHLVRSVAHYDRSTLEAVFRQNHWNALFLQFGTIFFLVILGLLIDQPVFQFPAGCSILVLLSLLTFFVGVIHYWFSEWRFVILTVFLIGINWVTSLDTFKRSNYAYGISYDQSPVTYSDENLLKIATDTDRVRQDSLATIELLNNWRKKQSSECPQFTLVCTSGGGLSAAYWSTRVMAELEKATNGELWQQTALMTGASGGMLGMAYLRELHQPENREMLYSDEHYRGVSSDLLNPIAFSIVSNDIFLPFTEVKIGDETYLRDRAYNFERQFIKNTAGLMDLPLSAYREAERKAELPLMILTPAIVNDGRLLAISAQNISYLMTSPVGRLTSTELSPDFVDLGSLLGYEQRDSLRFTTALRMNATYPYILPFVQLPTQPVVRIMDAGYRDNYGVLTAARFLQNFAPWIEANTCGVTMVQISAFKQRYGARQDEENPEGLIESLFGPVGLANNFFNVQSFEQDNTLAYLYDLLGQDNFHLFRFNYLPRDEAPLRAAISFHMTEAERRELSEAMSRKEHQEEVQRLSRFLGIEGRK